MSNSVNETISDVSDDVVEVSNDEVSSSQLDLTENEILRFRNIQLQKEVLSLKIKELERQETVWADMIKNRTGVDITGWGMDFESGICRPPRVNNAKLQ